jgi:phosphoribosylformylglycinamidine synthase
MARTSPFFEGISGIDLPIRHGEGRLMLSDPSRLGVAFKPAMAYSENPNGSYAAIAGITDLTGRIFGLMPHPEAFLRPSAHPEFFRKQIGTEIPTHGEGFRFFTNAFKGARAL